MDTEQIRLLAFPEHENDDMYYRRLRVLCGTEKRKNKTKPRIKRDRLSRFEQYFYWPADKKRPDQVPHRLGVNWLYIWFSQWAQRTSSKLFFDDECKEYEPILRPDAFAAIQTTDKLHVFFGEFHRHESENEFTKISQYTELFEDISLKKQRGGSPYWWVDPFKNQRIPTLLIVTTGAKGPILDRIRDENRLGIPIDLLTLDELKERCFQWAAQLSKSLVQENQGSL